MIRFDSAAIQKLFPKVSPITAYYSSSKTWVFPFFVFFLFFVNSIERATVRAVSNGIRLIPAWHSISRQKKMAYSTGLN